MSDCRLPINLTSYPPWKDLDHSEIKIYSQLQGGSTKQTEQGKLCEDAIESIKRHNATYVIYTDGSASGGTTDGGSAAVITEGDQEDPKIVKKIMKRGSTATCSYDEELEALKLAAAWIENNIHDSPIVLICTDSQALCKSLEGHYVGEVALIKYKLESLSPNIIIQWIPGHSNIPGNEIVDAAAKEAAELKEEEPGQISYNSVKAHIKRSIVDEPTAHERTAQIYKNYKYKKDNIITNRADQTTLARLRSGHHLGLKSYMHRLDDTIEPTCKHCPGENHDLNHWLTKCAGTADIRQRMFGTTELTLEHLVTHPKLVVEMSKATLL